MEASWNFFNSKKILSRKNDARVISLPELATVLEFTDNLKVKIVAAPFKFMYNLLSANHHGVGDYISLFEDPVIP